MSSNIRTVSLTEGSWQTLYAVVLEQVKALEAEGQRGMARKLMNNLAPALSSAAQHPDLEPVEKALRKRLGLAPIRHSKRPELVEDAPSRRVRRRRGAV